MGPLPSLLAAKLFFFAHSVLEVSSHSWLHDQISALSQHHASLSRSLSQALPLHERGSASEDQRITCNREALSEVNSRQKSTNKRLENHASRFGEATRIVALNNKTYTHNYTVIQNNYVTLDEKMIQFTKTSPDKINAIVGPLTGKLNAIEA